MDPPIVKSRAVLALVLIVPLLLAFYILTFLFQQQRIEQLQDEAAVLQAQIAELERQNAFYKKAYELTLDDIRTLARLYGGEDRYDRLADELRQGELEAIFNGTPPAQKYLIPDRNVWREYVERGIINISCLEPQAVDTIKEEVLVTVVASSAQPADLALYLDANFVERIDVAGRTERSFSIIIPEGRHELAFVSKRGGVAVDQVLMDATTLSGLRTDLGIGWRVFDCAEHGSGARLDAPGAVRLLIEKS